MSLADSNELVCEQSLTQTVVDALRDLSSQQ